MFEDPIGILGGPIDPSGTSIDTLEGFGGPYRAFGGGFEGHIGSLGVCPGPYRLFWSPYRPAARAPGVILIL